MSAFLEALLRHGHGRARVALDDVWRAFVEADPVSAASTDKRALLRKALGALVDTGVVQLPSTARRWDRSAEPPLPLWVQHVREATPRVAQPDTAWAPELEFARSVTNPKQLASLARVQAWLARGGRERPLVPARERALDIFGHEKAIDGMARSALFDPGRLTYTLLRCFPVSPPMVHRAEPQAPPVALIVENHHTYHSFVRWNERAKRYRAVAYGSGKAAVHGIGAFAQDLHALGVTTVEYFGDLDRAGIQILRAVAEAAAECGSPPIHPAASWYELLVERRAMVVPLRDDTVEEPLSSDLVTWFTDSLSAAGRETVVELLEAGLRLPQELVGWECLAGLALEGR
ncbi:MAG: hypothetical protein H6726_27235 [Sandaracinaceae bacterium]|nr:hypothetical protein [Sandaracinaceae bacterium]